MLVDFSGVELVTFRQYPGLGFCPVFGNVFSADIERNNTGDQIARLVVIEDGEVGVDECRFDLDIWLYEDFDCPILTELPEHTLSADERDRWLSVIASVEVQRLSDPFCETWAIDPCTIEEFHFDGSIIDSYPCQAPHLVYSEVARLEDALNALRP